MTFSRHSNFSRPYGFAACGYLKEGQMDSQAGGFYRSPLTSLQGFAHYMPAVKCVHQEKSCSKCRRPPKLYHRFLKTSNHPRRLNSSRCVRQTAQARLQRLHRLLAFNPHSWTDCSRTVLPSSAIYPPRLWRCLDDYTSYLLRMLPQNDSC